MARQERSFGVDLLRILCMLAIVVHHLFGHGWIIQLLNPDSWKYALASSLDAFCIFGISCFALISGYIGVQTKYRYTTLVLQWMKVFLYSVTIFAVVSLLSGKGLSADSMTQALLPTFKKQYWYFSAYAGCFLLSPLLRIALNRMNKRQATAMVVLLIAVFCVGPTLARTDAFSIDGGKSVLWLALLYILGGYLHRFEIMKQVSTAKIALLTLLSALLAMSAGEWMRRLSLLLTGEAAGYDLFRSSSSPTTLFLCVMMLLFFSRLNITHGKKLIAFLAPLNFSVYLIHDHPSFRHAVISRYAYILSETSTTMFVPAVIAAAICVYLLCAMIDALREQAFRRLRIKQRLLALEEKYIGFIWDE